MNQTRQIVIDSIINERLRQLDLPGSEFDARLSENDWIAIASKYLSESAARKHQKPNAAQYRDNLIKAGAVIVAALEHAEIKNQDR